MLQITQELLNKHPMRENETERQYRRRITRSKCVQRYNKYNTKQLNLRFNYNTDGDIISWLDNMSEAKASYIKRLIRDDIDKTREMYDEELQQQREQQIIEDQKYENE